MAGYDDDAEAEEDDTNIEGGQQLGRKHLTDATGKHLAAASCLPTSLSQLSRYIVHTALSIPSLKIFC